MNSVQVKEKRKKGKEEDKEPVRGSIKKVDISNADADWKIANERISHERKVQGYKVDVGCTNHLFYQDEPTWLFWFMLRKWSTLTCFPALWQPHLKRGAQKSVLTRHNLPWSSYLCPLILWSSVLVNQVGQTKIHTLVFSILYKSGQFKFPARADWWGFQFKIEFLSSHRHF